jgi:hypothetical protein
MSPFGGAEGVFLHQILKPYLSSCQYPPYGEIKGAEINLSTSGGG